MSGLRIVFLSMVLGLPSLAQQTKPNDVMKDCPMDDQHSAHQALVERHGDQAMGFPHDKTTHHFRMMSKGGAIEVSVNDPADKTDVEAIHSHLKHIAAMFSSGDFTTSTFIHDGIPPGSTTMKLLKGAIHYNYEETASGGKVRIETKDPIALAAIHDFIRFQITEHQTGDNLEVPQN